MYVKTINVSKIIKRGVNLAGDGTEMIPHTANFDGRSVIVFRIHRRNPERQRRHPWNHDYRANNREISLRLVAIGLLPIPVNLGDMPTDHGEVPGKRGGGALVHRKNATGF